MVKKPSKFTKCAKLHQTDSAGKDPQEKTVRLKNRFFSTGNIEKQFFEKFFCGKNFTMPKNVLAKRFFQAKKRK